MPRWSNRYFGSKEKLFAEVIERAFDIRYLIDGDRATLAERLARTVVYGREDIGAIDAYRYCSCCAPPRNPTRPKLIRASLERNVLRRSPSASTASTARSGPRWSLPSARVCDPEPDTPAPIPCRSAAEELVVL